MDVVFQVLGASVIGTVVGHSLVDFFRRSRDLKTVRRDVYRDLIEIADARHSEMERTIWTQSFESMNGHDRLSTTMAGVDLYASSELRRTLRECRDIEQRFWVTVSVQAPVSEDASGQYTHHFEKVRHLDPEGLRAVLRVSLGELAVTTTANSRK